MSKHYPEGTIIETKHGQRLALVQVGGNHFMLISPSFNRWTDDVFVGETSEHGITLEQLQRKYPECTIVWDLFRGGQEGESYDEV